MYKKLIILFLIIIFLAGCSPLMSEDTECYTLCRSKEYLKVDNSCDEISTLSVEKNCDIPFETIFNIKDKCFDICYQIQINYTNP